MPNSLPRTTLALLLVAGACAAFPLSVMTSLQLCRSPPAAGRDRLADGDSLAAISPLSPRADRAPKLPASNRQRAASGEVAAPQANRIFAHAKRLRDLGAGPTSQRQKHGARPVRLAAIT